LERFASLTLTVLICAVALGQFVQVITRYVLQIPVMGLEETMLYPTLWLYIFGAVNASREDTHIRANVLEVDLLASEPQRIACGLQRAIFDHVLSNPPYRKAGHVRTNPAKKAAHVVSDDDLDAWMRTAASARKPGGSLPLILAADGLMDLMEAFKGRFGAVTILGLHPSQDAPAERVLVRAIKGRKTPPRLLPGLVLHGEDGSYTRNARSILEGHAGIALSN